MRQRVGVLFLLYFLSFPLAFPSSRPLDDHPSLCTAPRPTGPFSFLIPAHLVFAFSPPQVRPPLVRGVLVLTRLAPNTCSQSLQIAGDPLSSESRTRKPTPVQQTRCCPNPRRCHALQLEPTARGGVFSRLPPAHTDAFAFLRDSESRVLQGNRHLPPFPFPFSSHFYSSSEHSSASPH